MPRDAPLSSPPASAAPAVSPALVAAAALGVGLLVRLATWSRTFAGGRVWIDGPDGYYHLRRAWLTLEHWPRAPQVDPLLGVPEGGPISWPPLFDLLLATLALPWRGESTAAVETAGAILPVLLGLVEMAALYWAVSRLLDRRAAAWAALFAAFLPGIARYSMLGALDHDPLIETFALVALGGIAGAARRRRPAAADLLWTALGLTLLFLTWVGSILHLAVLCLIAAVAALRGETAGGRAAPALALGGASLAAAAATLPWVLTSVWTERFGAHHVGLSWLHTAALLAAGLGGLALAWWRRRELEPRVARLLPGLMAPVAVALALLAALVWPALRGGLDFVGRGESMVQSITESRPLLALFGGFDPRAAIIRLSLLPLLLPLVLPLTLGGGRRRGPLPLLWCWLGCALAVALVQARWAHMAALPLMALAGWLVAHRGEILPRRLRAAGPAVVAALVLLPSLPAYLPVPGLLPFHLTGRPPLLALSGMDEVCDFLRDRVPPSTAWADPGRPSDTSVLAPWSFGHWLIWIGRQGAVATPLGPYGQPAFADGIRFYLLDDPGEAAELLARRRVRHVVAQAEIPPLESYGALAGTATDHLLGVDPASGQRVLRADAYLATIAARLAWTGTGEIAAFGRAYPALDGFREVFRTRRSRSHPLFGTVPLLRVYEVVPPPAGATGATAERDRAAPEGR